MKQTTIDVHDDALMVSLGIRPKPYVEVISWSKTKQEKEILANLRKIHKHMLHFSTKPKEIIPVKDKLIVQLKRNNKFANSTYSIKCYMHQIDEYINYFGKNIIAKYIFNGKTYRPEERPFWGII